MNFKGNFMSSIPLVEVVFEVRFKPKNNFATELLIEVNNTFENHSSITHTDGLQIPAEIKKNQPELYYVPSYKINYPSFSIFISDGSLVVLKNTLDSQYDGWDEFRPTPWSFIDILKKKNKILDILRISLKYTNLIPKESALDDLRLSIHLGDINLNKNTKITLQTEAKEDDYICLTDIASHVNLENFSDLEGKIRRLNGTLLVIDVIHKSGIKSLESSDREFKEIMEILHIKANQSYTAIYKQ